MLWEQVQKHNTRRALPVASHRLLPENTGRIRVQERVGAKERKSPIAPLRALIGHLGAR